MTVSLHIPLVLQRDNQLLNIRADDQLRRTEISSIQIFVPEPGFSEG